MKYLGVVLLKSPIGFCVTNKDMEEPFIEEEQEFQLEQRLLSATDITYARPSKRKVRVILLL